MTEKFNWSHNLRLGGSNKITHCERSVVTALSHCRTRT